MLWIILAGLGVMVAYQLHATLIYFALLLVDNPATRPEGWSTDTIYGLSRFLFLVLGGLWLVGVLFLESFLTEGARQQRLMRRVFWLLLAMALLYAATYLAQLLAA